MTTLREIKQDDAAAFLALCTRLDEETRLMMLEPGERTTSVEEQRHLIAEIMATPNSALFVAEAEGALVGYVGAYGGRCRRNRHCAEIVIGILQAYTGQGLGTRLLTRLENWAREQGLHRLELTVMVHNVPAVALYRKQGFFIEGLRRHSLCVDGQWVDEYAMVKLLD